MKNKLHNNKHFFNEYDRITKDYTKEDIIEIVPPSEDIMLTGPAHYLLHRAVVNENRKTVKVRIVFDYSAHSPNEQMSHLLITFYNPGSGPWSFLLIFDVLVQ